MRESMGPPKPRGAMKRETRVAISGNHESVRSAATARPGGSLDLGAALERTRWHPKDGELCPCRTRPEETLVEVRSDSDVQIDRPTRV